jgi:hypothetical protein
MEAKGKGEQAVLRIHQSCDRGRGQVRTVNLDTKTAPVDFVVDTPKEEFGCRIFFLTSPHTSAKA